MARARRLSESFRALPLGGHRSATLTPTFGALVQVRWQRIWPFLTTRAQIVSRKGGWFDRFTADPDGKGVERQPGGGPQATHRDDPQAAEIHPGRIEIGARYFTSGARRIRTADLLGAI